MRYTIFALLGAVALAGCGNTGTGGDGDEETAPAFAEGSGQQPQSALAYPPGPYGTGKGSTVANFKFIGFPNAMQDTTQLKELQLAEFYNPTGDGVYGEGSPMGPGAPKPKALLLAVSAVWCGPCNYEADQVLPGLYAKYKPQRGEFFVQLADGPTPGKAATSKSLFNWTQKYDVDYPMAIDPSYKLSALFAADAFPANMILDTRTMTLVEVISGAPEADGPFWATFDEVLAGTQ
jgi:hypothetical protein